jgi:presenilin-like A22 family membrane protease
MAQFVGLIITKNYLIKDLPYNLKRPPIEEKTSFLQLFLVIIIVTLVAILLAKFKLALLWKVWFFLAVVFCLSISLAAFINQIIAVLVAIALTIFKVVKRNLIVHNFTELFIYGALAAIFVPLFNVTSIIILLVLISVYDMIAVWKTKHMIKLAKFQAKLRLFTGLFIPYKKGTAILGGGDIGFPLLFSGVMLKTFGNKAFIVPVIVTIALFILFLKSKKKKFYPAMPFLTLGCLAGFWILLLI